MSTETNKAICRRMLEQLWNEHRVDLVQEFFAEDVVQHVVGGPEMPPGPEELKEVLTVTLAAFPDIQLTVDDEIAEGDKVVFRWTMTATHQGGLMGIPATGKQITRSGAAIYRLDNAKIAELWFFADNLEFMQQLGAIPTPEAA
jgi:steroid delta-isomerase-like uncharacterized protein